MCGLDWRNRVEYGCSCAVEGGGVRWVRAGGHSTVGWRHRDHLPLQELQDHVDVCGHPCLQSKWRERETFSGIHHYEHVSS